MKTGSPMETENRLLSLWARDAKVALKSVSYDLTIIGVCCEAAVSQKFRNDNPFSIEAVYVIPNDEGAVITEMSFETDGKKYRTSVMEKNEAFKMYDKAIKAGDGSFLIDSIARDALQISVGNLKPGQEIDLTLRWVQELPEIDGSIKLFFPLTRFPRYCGNQSDLVRADIQNATLSDTVPYQMQLRLSWENNLIKECISTSHKKWARGIEKRSGTFETILLSEGIDGFTRDLDATFPLADPETNIGYIAKNKKGLSFLYARIFPKLESWDTGRAKQVVFFLDCSGSMDGDSIIFAKKALSLCVKSLNGKDTFRLVLFGTGFRVLTDKNNRPFRFNSENIARSLAQINSVRADMGGTELYNAIEKMLDEKNDAEEWVLISDGGVTDPERVIQLVAGTKDPPRVFTIGIGNGASTSLLKGLARATGGACEMLADEKAIPETVLRQFARIDQPYLQNLILRMGKSRLDTAEPLKAVFEGDSWNAVARLGKVKKTDAVALKATIGKTILEFTAPVVDVGNIDSLGRLWASKKVRFLEDTVFKRGSNQAVRRKNSNLDEALKIALEYQVLSSQTSLVGIETRLKKGKWVEKPAFEMVPSLNAAGKMGESFSRGCFVLNCSDEADTSVLCRKSGDGVPSFMRPDSAKIEKIRTYQTSGDRPSWYFDLCDTIDVEGFFELEKTVSILKKMYPEIEVVAGGLSGKYDDSRIVASLIAVKALESDAAAKKICKKFIIKSIRALKKAGIRDADRREFVLR